MSNEINPSLGVLDKILSGAMQADQQELNIIEFVDQLLDLGALADGSKIRPWITQRAMLKAFYGLPMEPDEQAIIESWVAAGKCTWKPGKAYRELVLESGMRSSKTALTSWIVLYEFYKLLLLPSPQVTYGFPKSQPIFIIALATTEQQSKDTVFGYIKSYMEGSPYFMGMVTKGDLQIDSLRIKCHSKNVTIIAGHSNSAGLVGRTAKIACFDELARFENKDGSAKNGMDVKANIGRSTTSFREHGRIVSISSAWEEGDAMVQLYAAAEDDSTGMLGFRLNSFDMNPTLRRDDPYIVAQYKQNEVAARRDFEGIRPGSQESFFNRRIVEEASTGSQCLTYASGHNIVGSRTYSKVNLGHLTPLQWPHYSYAHADPGLKHDSFAFAVGHGERSERGTIAVIDGLVEWRPQRSKRPEDKGKNVIWPNDLENVEDTIMTICQERNVRRLTFDHWQSASMVQRLYSNGIPAEDIHFSQSFQCDIYYVLRERMANQLVVLPDPESSEAAAKLHQELIELQFVNGRKIDHKPGGCFTGETRVALADGTCPTFQELAERYGPNDVFYVYSMSPKGVQIAPARYPRITKVATELVEIMLDNFQVIRCTPEHLFMTLDGDWIQAQNLTPDVSIMPLYRSRNYKGGWADYEQVWCPIQKKSLFTHHLAVGAEIPEGYIVHHVDRNKGNNDPRNLELMLREDHYAHHAEELWSARKGAMQEGFKKHFDDPTNRKKQREHMNNLWAAGKFGPRRAECAIEGCFDLSDARGLCGKHYQQARRAKKLPSRTSGKVNHRILSVKHVTSNEPVYDLSVPGLENFALASGVFVHNSKDLADAVAMVVYKIVEDERRTGRRAGANANPKAQVVGKTRIPQIRW